MKCLDTYALIEICNGNPAFVDLLREEVVITDITLAEFYGNLYRKYGLKTAEYWNRKLSPFCRPVPREILIQAIRFRIDPKDKNLSFFDGFFKRSIFHAEHLEDQQQQREENESNDEPRHHEVDDFD